MPFSFGVMAVGGGNVAVGLGFGSTVVVNVVDVVCSFCFCCVLGGGVVDLDLPWASLRKYFRNTQPATRKKFFPSNPISR